jgi:hypothetical protein
MPPSTFFARQVKEAERALARLEKLDSYGFFGTVDSQILVVPNPNRAITGTRPRTKTSARYSDAGDQPTHEEVNEVIERPMGSMEIQNETQTTSPIANGFVDIGGADQAQGKSMISAVSCGINTLESLTSKLHNGGYRQTVTVLFVGW